MRSAFALASTLPPQQLTNNVCVCVCETGYEEFFRKSAAQQIKGLLTSVQIANNYLHHKLSIGCIKGYFCTHYNSQVGLVSKGTKKMVPGGQNNKIEKSFAPKSIFRFFARMISCLT